MSTTRPARSVARSAWRSAVSNPGNRTGEKASLAKALITLTTIAIVAAACGGIFILLGAHG